MADRSFLTEEERLALQAALVFARDKFAVEYRNDTTLAIAMGTTQQALSKLGRHGYVGPDVGRKIAQFLFDRRVLDQPEIFSVVRRFAPPRKNAPTWEEVDKLVEADRVPGRQQAARLAKEKGTALPEAVVAVLEHPAGAFATFGRAFWMRAIREQMTELARHDDEAGRRAVALLAEADRVSQQTTLDGVLASADGRWPEQTIHRAKSREAERLSPADGWLAWLDAQAAKEDAVVRSAIETIEQSRSAKMIDVSDAQAASGRGGRRAHLASTSARKRPAPRSK